MELPRPTDISAPPKPLVGVSGRGLDSSTPMYPSLNAPSSSDPPAAQPLNGNVKMGYSSSQTFSSPGSVPPSTSFRQSPAHSYGYVSPDGAHSMMGLSYASLGEARPNGSNGNGVSSVQQGVWSPSAFGTGYGYGMKSSQGVSNMDEKTAMAFNTVSSIKDHAQPYQSAFVQQTQSPQGYSSVPSPHGPHNAQTYGQTPGPYGRGIASALGGGGIYYPYNASGSSQLTGETHFSQQGREHPSRAGKTGDAGGYHVSAAGQHQQVQGRYQTYGSHGAIGQQGRAAGGTGVSQGQGAKKMW